MVYSRAWSSTTPSGTAAASTIDDEIRNHRLDIAERMDDITHSTGKWSTGGDPVILDSGSLDIAIPTQTRTGLTVFFPPAHFQSRFDEDDCEITNNYVHTDTQANRYMFGSLHIPVGCSLTALELQADRLTATSFTFDLLYTTWASPGTAAVSVGTDTVTLTGIQTATINGLPHTIADGRIYTMRVDNNNQRIRIYGVRATLDVTDLGDYIG